MKLQWYLGLGLWDITPRMENQMKKYTENVMEITNYNRFSGLRSWDVPRQDPKIENKIEKNVENEMELGLCIALG